MELAEEFIKYCVQWALDNCMEDIKFLNDMFDKELIARLEKGLERLIRFACRTLKESRYWKRLSLKRHKFEFLFIGV